MSDDAPVALEHRVRLADLFDAEIARHNEHFRRAAEIRSGEQVLDIGCGTGQTTREAARAAAPGEVLGVDVSAAALDLGRRRVREEGLDNVSFQDGDAQVYPFPAGHFDVAISRFGVMFFRDPLAAFANIAHALRPGARLVALVWQSHDRDEWSTAVRDALAPNTPRPTPPIGLDPFSLAEPSVVDELLGRAGFGDVSFADVHEPVYYGPDVQTAAALVLGLREPKELLAGLEPAEAERARRRLHEVLAAHHGPEGVLFDSAAWIITAERGR